MKDDLKLSFGCVKFEMPFRYPTGDGEYFVEYILRCRLEVFI